MSLEEKKNTTEEDIIDISLNPIRKKRFRVDGDYNKMLELNTSDMNIIPRLQEGYPKLQELLSKATDKLLEQTDADTDDLEKIAATLKEIDGDMRKWIDYIFDADVSSVLSGDGSMYDPFAGKFRFEYIIETLSKLYEDNIEKEMNAMSARVKKHTSKYHK